MRGHVCVDEQSLTQYREGWVALAAEAGRPLCHPDWLLAWWRSCRPSGASLLVVVVLDGERLVGVLPLYSTRGRGGLVHARLLAANAAIGVAPVAVADPGRVADAMTDALAQATPAVDLLWLDGVPAQEGWPTALRQRSGAPVVRSKVVAAPRVALDAPSYDAWLGRRSSNFRQQLRRFRRRFEGEGGTFHLATAEQAPEVLEAFTRLHLQRWEERGGSSAVDDRVHGMLLLAVPGLIDRGSARLHYAQADGEVVAAALILVAGPESSYWLGGFDDRYARNSLSILLLGAAIEAGVLNQERSLDLGAGDQPYKQRFAEDAVDLEWATVVLGTGLRRAPAWALVRGRAAARTAVLRLPDGAQATVRSAIRRVSRLSAERTSA